MIKISDINQIDRSTPEGSLLWAALVELTTQLYSGKTPYQVISKLKDIAAKGEQDVNERNRLDADQQKKKAETEASIKLSIETFEKNAGRTIESIDLIGVPSFVPGNARMLSSVRLNLKQI